MIRAPIFSSSSATLLLLAALMVPACASTILTTDAGASTTTTGTGGASSGGGGGGCGPACSPPPALWSRGYEATSTLTATAIAADGVGNVVILGTVGGSVDFGAGAVDFGQSGGGYLLSLDPAGAYRFAVPIGAVNGSRVQWVDLAIGAGGDIFATGEAYPVQGTAEAFVARFDGGGHLLWAVPYGPEPEEVATHLAVAPSGDVVIAGYWLGPEPDPWAAQDTGLFVAAFDPSGALLWDQRVNVFTVNEVVAVAVDAAGSVLLAGGCTVPPDFGGAPLPADSTAYLVKLDAAGHFTWSTALAGAGDANLFAVAVDAAGNPAVSGVRNLPVDAGVYPVPTQAFVQRYTASGQLAWSRDVNVISSTGSAAIALTADGTLVAAGARSSPDGYDSMVAVERLDAAGNPLGEQVYGGQAGVFDVAVAVDPAGAVIVCGDYSGTIDFGQGALQGSPSEGNAFVAKLGKP